MFSSIIQGFKCREGIVFSLGYGISEPLSHYILLVVYKPQQTLDVLNDDFVLNDDDSKNFSVYSSMNWWFSKNGA